jgi:GDP-L-fucose synthase
MANKLFWSGKKVLVTGGGGFIGSHVVENLIQHCGVAREAIVIPRSKDCDLRHFENCQKAVEGCNIVIHLAAVTGGISFSRAYPASQYRDSSLIDMNVIEAARQAQVEKLVAIGNVFAYAPDAPVPLREDALFNGLPTDAHRGVGWMKRNLALLADLYYRQYNFPMVVVYSANAYGPGDSINPAHAHVIPATIMKCFRDAELVVWGDGTPTRDFLFVDDIAAALILAAETLTPPTFVNIGSGTEISVRQLVELIVLHSGFAGKVVFDTSKSGGDARRCVNMDKARELIHFEPAVTMNDGLRQTIQWYRSKLLERKNEDNHEAH